MVIGYRLLNYGALVVQTLRRTSAILDWRLILAAPGRLIRLTSLTIAAVALGGCVEHIAFGFSGGPADHNYGRWGKDVIVTQDYPQALLDDVANLETEFDRNPTPVLAHLLVGYYAVFPGAGRYKVMIDRDTRRAELLVFAATAGHRGAVADMARFFRDGPYDYLENEPMAECLNKARMLADNAAVAPAVKACGLKFAGFTPAAQAGNLRQITMTPAQ